MQRRIVGCCLIIASFMIVLSGCAATSATADQTTYWPIHDWQTSTPEEQGLDSSLILAMLQEIQNKNLRIHSLLIIRHGYLVTEVYFPPYQPDMQHPIFSGTKSVTSLLMGKALQEGHLKDVQQKVLDFFPEIAREVTDPRVKDLTLEHLLTMSAGFNTNTMPNLNSAAAAADTVKHILTYDSILVKPGSTFYYDSGLPHLLSAVIQRTTGMTLQDYAQQKLFEPLGITDVSWQTDPQGVTTGNTGLLLRPRDMAKIGYLVLQQGQWNGTQVVPDDWVSVLTAKHIETKGLMNAAEDDGYGYLWWIDDWGGYSAHGFGGQYLFVLPAQDMVVVFTGGLPDPIFPVPKQLVQAYLLPAARATEALPANPQAFNDLTKQIQEIEQPMQPIVPLPEVARRISGKTFQVTHSSSSVGQFQALTLTFGGGNTYRMETEWPGNQTITVDGGLDNIFRLNPVKFKGFLPTEDLLVALRGRWQNDQTFIEEYVSDVKTEIELITLKTTFKGNQVMIEVSSSMQPDTLQAVGELTP